MALAWDPLRGDTSTWPDRGFFLDRIRELGEPVLDVGCGTGRLLLDFLALGIDIDGVEISPDMLAILRTKAADSGLDVEGRIHESPKESMTLARRYRLVLVPSSSFQLIQDGSTATAAMARLADHLEPGGTLVMPWIDIALDHPDGADEHFTDEGALPDGTTIRRTFLGTFDPATGFESTDDHYQRLRDGVVIDDQRIVRSPATRHYDRDEIAALHAAAGLEDLRFVSGFTMEAAGEGDRIVTTLARRPV